MKSFKQISYMVKNILLVLLVGLSIVVMTACSHQQSKETASTIKVVAANGEVNLPKEPKKIVVLDFGVADTIRALGYEDRIVGMPTQVLPEYLKELGSNKKITNVGNLKEVNLEKIANLSPDLIIASGRTQKQLAEFNKIAPTVYFNTDANDYLGSVKKNIIEVAKLFGQETVTKAEQEVTVLDDLAILTREANEKAAETTLMLLLNEGNMAGIGPKGRYGFIYTSLGFQPTSLEIKEDQKTQGSHGQSLSFESISAVNPDRILVIDRTLAIGGDQSKNADVLNNKLIANTKAGQHNKITTLNSDIWYLSGGGLESTRLMFEELAELVVK